MQPEGYAITRHYFGENYAYDLYRPLGQHGELERWQWEWLRYRPYWSLFFRGLFYGPQGASNSIAMWLALRTPRIKDVMWAGRWHEAYFPMLAYILTIGAVMAIN